MENKEKKIQYTNWGDNVYNVGDLVVPHWVKWQSKHSPHYLFLCIKIENHMASLYCIHSTNSNLCGKIIYRGKHIFKKWRRKNG